MKKVYNLISNKNLLYIMKKYSFVKQTIAQKIDQTLFNKYGLKEPLAMELAG